MEENNIITGCGCGESCAENEEAAALFNIACELEKKADSSEGVSRLIEALKAVLVVDPVNYAAHWRIGNYHILMGAAYASKKKQKKFHYREAERWCENAMHLNPCFKQRFDDGQNIWEAVDQLGIKYIDTMGYWYTARFYYFKECLSPFTRLFKLQIPINNNAVIARIDELDPDWAGGGNFMSRAIYLIAIPERYGGSKVKAAEEFEKAIKAGPDFLVNRWGRAKYLYSLTGNKQGYIEDIEWVLSRDPHNSGNTYPWNVYFQWQAKEMLADADKLFR